MPKMNKGRLEAIREDLTPGVEPLTDEERKWIASLERVLKAQPDRLRLVECGDIIFVVDRAASGFDVELQDGKARENGVWLADVRHSEHKLTGVSG